MRNGNGERWIVIPRWDDFQHYSNRDPTWIKTYSRQLRDDAYMSLSYAQRGVLHDLRIMYALTDGQLSQVAARRMLGSHQVDARYLLGHLEALNHAGFIQFRASKPLAQSKRKRNKDLPGTKNGHQPGYCRTCGIKPKGSMKDHMSNVHGAP